jgi:hypothetical protein
MSGAEFHQRSPMITLKMIVRMTTSATHAMTRPVFASQLIWKWNYFGYKAQLATASAPEHSHWRSDAPEALLSA